MGEAKRELARSLKPGSAHTIQVDEVLFRIRNNFDVRQEGVFRYYLFNEAAQFFVGEFLGGDFFEAADFVDHGRTSRLRKRNVATEDDSFCSVLHSFGFPG
jgi:hypothetical protein